jgi:hypothetical protein
MRAAAESGRLTTSKEADIGRVTDRRVGDRVPYRQTPTLGSGCAPGSAMQIAPPVPVAAQAGVPPAAVEQKAAQVLIPPVAMQALPRAHSLAAAQRSPGCFVPAAAHMVPVAVA